jgi:hypothetical protein
VKDGVQYLQERFLNSEDSVEICTKVFDDVTWPTLKELIKFCVEENQHWPPCFG